MGCVAVGARRQVPDVDADAERESKRPKIGCGTPSQPSEASNFSLKIMLSCTAAKLCYLRTQGLGQPKVLDKTFEYRDLMTVISFKH